MDFSVIGFNKYNLYSKDITTFFKPHIPTELKAVLKVRAWPWAVLKQKSIYLLFIKNSTVLNPLRLGFSNCNGRTTTTDSSDANSNELAEAAQLPVIYSNNSRPQKVL